MPSDELTAGEVRALAAVAVVAVGAFGYLLYRVPPRVLLELFIMAGGAR